MSGAMNQSSSTASMNTMKVTQHIDTMAPVIVGCKK
jgi:hypothetical protein